MKCILNALKCVYKNKKKHEKNVSFAASDFLEHYRSVFTKYIFTDKHEKLTVLTLRLK